MAASAVCSICSDHMTKFYRPDPEPGEPVIELPNNVNTMVSPACGHAFHAYCITRWMTGSAVMNGSCPNCRKPIPRKKCNPLFLDTYDTTILMDTSASLPGLDTGDSEALREQLKEANKNIRHGKNERDSIQSELNELKQTMEAVSNENTALIDRLDTEKVKSQSYMTKYQEAQSYKTYAEEQEKEVTKLKAKLEKFKYLQQVVDGVRTQTVSDLKTFPISRTSISSLLDIKNVLQQEIENSKAKHQTHKNEKESDRKEMLRLRAEIERLKKDNSEMEFRISSNQRVRIAPATATSGPSTSSASTLAENKLPYIIPVSDQSSTTDDGDDDVGVMTGLGAGLKRSRSTRMGRSTSTILPSLKRSGSCLPSSKGRLVREMDNAEPLTPLNIHIRSSIPGLAFDGVQSKDITKAPSRPKAVSMIRKAPSTGLTWKF